MPNLIDRLDREERYASQMIASITQPRVDWQSLFRQLDAISREQLSDVFVNAYLNMTPEPTDADRVAAPIAAQRWASDHCRTLALAATVNFRHHNCDPTKIETRLRSMAVTEITRANTTGETAFRVSRIRSRRRTLFENSRLRQRDDSGRFDRTTSSVLLSIGDGLTAIWVTVGDDRVCPICAPLNGDPADHWFEEFPDGPPAHPRCRCELIYTEE